MADCPSGRLQLRAPLEPSEKLVPAVPCLRQKLCLQRNAAAFGGDTGGINHVVQPPSAIIIPDMMVGIVVIDADAIPMDFFRRFGGKVPFGIRCGVVCLCHGAYLSLVTRPARLPSLGDARHVHGSRPLDPADEESAVFSLPGLRIPTRGPCTTVAALRCSAGGVGLSTDPSMDTCMGIFRMVPRIRKPGDVKEQYQHDRQFPDGSKSFSMS